MEDFQRGWTRFEFVAAAKEWNANKQLAAIPTLLRGRLIDYYVELDDETKADLKLLKAALQERAGTKKDPLLASKNFNQWSQGPDEKVNDYASALKKLFKIAYPESYHATSHDLGPRFLDNSCVYWVTSIHKKIQSIETIEYYVANHKYTQRYTCQYTQVYTSIH